MRVQVGRRGKAGTKNRLFKTNILDFFFNLCLLLPWQEEEGRWPGCECTRKTGRVGQVGAPDQLPQQKTTSLESGSWIHAGIRKQWIE